MTAHWLPLPSAKLAQLGIDPARIRDVKPRSRRTHCQAIINWLTRYHPSTDAANLEQVKGYLEAFHLLCRIQEWERAANLMFTKLNTPADAQLHYHLKLWGYTQEQAGLYEALSLITLNLNGMACFGSSSAPPIRPRATTCNPSNV